jgi:anti-sigma B factor antagonist
MHSSTNSNLPPAPTASDPPALAHRRIDFPSISLEDGRERSSEQGRGDSPRMKISTRKVEDVTVVDISGQIVLGAETGLLRSTVHDLVNRADKKIILNLADVSYIDSSGLGELIASYTTVRNQGGQLKLLNLTKKVRDLLLVTKLYTIFDIKDSEYLAVKSFDWFFAK